MFYELAKQLKVKKDRLITSGIERRLSSAQSGGIKLTPNARKRYPERPRG
jgi:hypothetical protein